MKKFSKLLLICSVSFLITSCTKDHDFVRKGIIDESETTDIQVENDYLSFKTVEIFNQYEATICNMDENDYSDWVAQFDGFSSAKLEYSNAEQELSSIKTENEYKNFLDKYKDKFNVSLENGIEYKFFARSYAPFLNLDGIVKIEGVLYKFSDNKQISILTGEYNDLKKYLSSQTIENLNEIDVFYPNTKGSSLLKTTWGTLWQDSYQHENRKLYVFLDLMKIFSPVYNNGVHIGWNVGFELRLNAYQKKKTLFGWIKHTTEFVFWDASYNLTYFGQGYSSYLGGGSYECKDFRILYLRISQYLPADQVSEAPRPTIHNVYTKITSRGIDTNYIIVDYSD